MEQKTKINRQIVEGTDSIRIYSGRLLLSNKKLPIITRHQTEVMNWIFLNEQQRIHDEIHEGHGSGKIGIFEKTESSNQSVHPLVEAILEIPGVAYAIPASYQLIIIKAELFTWDEIEKPVLLLMSSFNLDNLENIGSVQGVDYQAEKTKNAGPTTNEKTPRTV